jgi:hypothetical protein
MAAAVNTNRTYAQNISSFNIDYLSKVPYRGGR